MVYSPFLLLKISKKMADYTKIIYFGLIIGKWHPDLSALYLLTTPLLMVL